MAKCNRCDGDGKVECVQCYGSGRHGNYPNPEECAYCGGEGKIDCPDCGGTGED